MCVLMSFEMEEMTIMRLKYYFSLLFLLLVLCACGNDEKNNEEQSQQVTENDEVTIEFKNGYCVDGKTNKFLTENLLKDSVHYDDYTGNISSKTGTCYMEKTSMEYTYNVKKDGMIVWDGLMLNGYLSQVLGGEDKKDYYVCDVYSDDTCFDILLYFEREDKFFLVLKFDYTEKKYLTFKKFDMNGVEHDMLPMVDGITTPMLTKEMIIYSSFSQDIYKVELDTENIQKLSDMKNDLLNKVSEDTKYEAVGWFRPIAYSEGYIIVYATLLEDKTIPESADKVVALYNENGQLYDYIGD